MAGVLGLGMNYRGIQIFPWFIAGALVPREWLTDRITEPRIRYSLLSLFIGFWIYLCFDWSDAKMPRLITSQSAYTDDPYGILWHLFYYGVSTINLLTVLAWIPRRKIPYISDWGQHTMYPYLLHRFLLIILENTGFFVTNANNGLTALYITMPIIAGCCLSTTLARRFTWPMFEPNLSCLLIPEIPKIENKNGYHSLENGNGHHKNDSQILENGNAKDGLKTKLLSEN